MNSDHLSIVEDNFLARIRFGTKEQCWEWQGSLAKKGYGRISYYKSPNIYNVPAHRLSYTYFIGPIPEGMQVLHHCDNRKCVNPRHLFLGTNLDNVKDKIAKGRQIRGTQIGRAKINEEAVRDIRERVANGESRRALAKVYGLGHTTVNCIVARMNWTHVA